MKSPFPIAFVIAPTSGTALAGGHACQFASRSLR